MKPKVHNIGKCANLQCTNQAHEGQFLMVDTDIDVGGHRTISLFMCSPCGDAFVKNIGQAEPAYSANLNPVAGDVWRLAKGGVVHILRTPGNDLNIYFRSTGETHPLRSHTQFPIGGTDFTGAELLFRLEA